MSDGSVHPREESIPARVDSRTTLIMAPESIRAFKRFRNFKTGEERLNPVYWVQLCHLVNTTRQNYFLYYFFFYVFACGKFLFV